MQSTDTIRNNLVEYTYCTHMKQFVRGNQLKKAKHVMDGNSTRISEDVWHSDSSAIDPRSYLGIQ